MEKVLNDQIIKQINEVFEGIQEPVQVPCSMTNLN